MTRHHRSCDPSPSCAAAAVAPPILVSLMAAFRGFFTAPVWDHVLVLITGVVLTPGKRTVSAALRIMGLSQTGDFALYHHVLSQARWDSRAIARTLLTMILDRFLPAGPLIIGIDDTIERRWGAKIAGIRATHVPQDRPPTDADMPRKDPGERRGLLDVGYSPESDRIADMPRDANRATP